MKKYIYSFWPLYLTCIVAFVILVTSANRAVTAIANNMPVKRGKTIIIDAGHGGDDGGATSCTGVLESSINLEIALRLEDLMHLLGYNTVMIRRTDTSVYTEGDTIATKKISDLKERVRVVNETQNCILLSIHQNIFADSRYAGAQVFYNDVEAAQTLAERLQNNFIATLNVGSHRNCKKSEGVYLMQHITQPGLLVECGFLSNPDEEAKLRTREYQQKISCVIAATLAECLN